MTIHSYITILNSLVPLDCTFNTYRNSIYWVNDLSSTLSLIRYLIILTPTNKITVIYYWRRITVRHEPLSVIPVIFIKFHSLMQIVTGSTVIENMLFLDHKGGRRHSIAWMECIHPFPNSNTKTKKRT